MGPRLMSRGGVSVVHEIDGTFTTSMGPRLMSRGGDSIRSPSSFTSATSMGPRLMSRGGELHGVQGSRLGVTSMGPRLMSRGGGSTRSVSCSGRYFNGAATHESRRRASTLGVTPAKPLQWGRDS